MDIKPVRHYSNPNFPTRRIVDQHPELLQLVPKRWQANPAVIAALAGMCVFLAGCKDQSTQSVPSKIAPIFQHGDGYGAFGCRAVNPPVFLSEADARQVIIDEAKRAGLKLDTHKTPSIKMRGPATTTMPGHKTRSQNISLELDGKDAKHNISFEYVSISDFYDWRRINLWDYLEISTASKRDILRAAKVLQSGLAKKHPSGTYAVFYDPCVGRRDVEKKYGLRIDYNSAESWKKSNRQVTRKAKQLAQEELRAQVKDFIKWLRAQGVI